MSEPGDTDERIPTGALLWVVALVSAGALAFEVALMRVLLVASWHHFAFLVISIALLGFGASGTALCLARSWLLRHARTSLTLLALLTAASMPLCVRAAQWFPVEAQFLPALLWRQIGAWVAYWVVLAIPFLGAGATIGLGLMLAQKRVGVVYAANLIGSAAGAILITPAMLIIPPAWLPLVTGAATLTAALGTRRALGIIGIGVVGAGIGATAWLSPPDVRVDEFKYGAYVQRLADAGDAERVGITYSPRGVAEVWQGDAFHEIPFLSVDAIPPAVSPIVIDGHWAGTLLRAQTPDQARATLDTLMAAPYALVPGRPRVALLGEIGGVNVWLAALRDSAEIRLVQPHHELLRLLGRLAPDRGAAFLDLESLERSAASPRHFIEHTRRRYDLIQLVGLESMGAGSGGVGGLAENHLMTVEGIDAALDALSEQGILTVCRAIQSPPRDNLKILTTLAAALERRAVDRPADHIVVLRDFLGVCTIAKPTPWTPAQIDGVRALCADRNLTPVWFPSIRPDELNHPDALPGPPGEPGDWLHHGAVEILSENRADFIRDWAFDIRPPTDARPFFLDFARLSSIPAMREAYGNLWLTRAELAYLFVLGASAVIALLGASVTVAPLLLLRSLRAARPKLAAAVYFGALGLAYLSLEMVVLSRMTNLVGDEVRAASLTIATFLLFSGLGSLWAQRLLARRQRRARLIVAGVAVIAALDLLALTPLVHHAGALALWARMTVGAVGVAPMALLMGFPFPLGLARLDEHAPALVPWAWGVNGFASVLAAPLATSIAMTWSYDVTALGALALYALAAITLGRLPAR